MTSPEFPDHNPLEQVPPTLTLDYLPEYLVLNEYDKRQEALEEIAISLGRAAMVSDKTWPRSLHSIKLGTGEIIIRTNMIEAEHSGEILNITVNKAEQINDDGGVHLEVYDFVVSSDYDAVTYKKSIIERDYEEDRWEYEHSAGIVLYVMFDRVQESYGEHYALPAIRTKPNRYETDVDVINEAMAAEHLTAWLNLMDETSYEEYPSRGI
jgi:hypothetical protein